MKLDVAVRTAQTADRLLREARAREFWITPDCRIGERDAAELIGWCAGHLRNARSEGRAPRFYRIGGAGHRVSYRIDDLAEFIESLAQS